MHEQHADSEPATEPEAGVPGGAGVGTGDDDTEADTPPAHWVPVRRDPLRSRSGRAQARVLRSGETVPWARRVRLSHRPTRPSLAATGSSGRWAREASGGSIGPTTPSSTAMSPSRSPSP